MDVAISGSTPAVEQETIKLVACGDAGLFEAASRIFDAFGLMSCSRERQKPRLDGTPRLSLTSTSECDKYHIKKRSDGLAFG